MSAAGRAHGGNLSKEEQALVDALAGEIPRVPKSPLYVVGLCFVTVAMVLLPVIYLAMIAGVAWLVWLHAVNDASILAGHGGGRARLLVYLAPIIIGAVVILFMLKPLFVRPARRETAVALPRDDEPLVHAYVERLCEIVHAPRPRAIELSSDVNASASFRRGWLGWASGGLTLTIGMPLVAGMTLRQLTGVLAHELGHFAQGVGMHLSYVVDVVNGWFARVVYERDEWDEGLANLRKGSNAVSWIVVVYGTQAMVWLTRRILWMLMVVGRGISCFMSRQMEYDADLYEARVAGSAAFAGMFRRLYELGLAHSGAHDALREGWRERRLPDDVAALTVSFVSKLPAEAVQYIDKQFADGRTGWFDTHPAVADRVRAAERMAAPGIARDDRPGTTLFRNFHRWSRAATLEYYQGGLGLDVDHGQLVSTSGTIAEQERQTAAHQQVEAYLGHCLDVSRPARISDGVFTRSATARELVAELAAAQHEIAAQRDAARAAHERYRKASQQLCNIDVAALQERFGLKFNPAELGLPSLAKDAVEAVRSAAVRERAEALEVLRPYDALVERRLTAALRLLKAKGIEKYVPDAESLLAEAMRLCEVLAKVLPIVDARNFHQREAVAMSTAIRALQGECNQDAAMGSLRSSVAAFTTFIREHRRSVYNVPYPYAHGGGAISVGQYLFPDGDVTEPPAVVESTGRASESLGTLYERLIARIVAIAVEVERGLARNAKRGTPDAAKS